MEMFGLPLLSHALQIQFAPKNWILDALSTPFSYLCSGNSVDTEQKDRTGFTKEGGDSVDRHQLFPPLIILV